MVEENLLSLGGSVDLFDDLSVSRIYYPYITDYGVKCGDSKQKRERLGRNRH